MADSTPAGTLACHMQSIDLLPAVVHFGIELYGNCCQTYLNKLMVLNNKLLRILQNIPWDSKIVDLYNTVTLPNKKIEVQTYGF